MAAATIPTLAIPWLPEFDVMVDAARWAQANLRDDVVIGERKRVVGYYAMHPYFWWNGETGGVSEAIQTAQRTDNLNATAPIVLGKLFEHGRDITESIAGYKEIARFGDRKHAKPAATRLHPLRPPCGSSPKAKIREHPLRNFFVAFNSLDSSCFVARTAQVPDKLQLTLSPSPRETHPSAHPSP